MHVQWDLHVHCRIIYIPGLFLFPKGSAVSAGQCVLAIFSLLFTDQVPHEWNNPSEKRKSTFALY